MPFNYFRSDNIVIPRGTLLHREDNNIIILSVPNIYIHYNIYIYNYIPGTRGKSGYDIHYIICIHIMYVLKTTFILWFYRI